MCVRDRVCCLMSVRPSYACVIKCFSSVCSMDFVFVRSHELICVHTLVLADVMLFVFGFSIVCMVCVVVVCVL